MKRDNEGGSAAKAAAAKVAIVLAANIVLSVLFPLALSLATSSQIDLQSGAEIALLTCLLLTVGELAFRIEGLYSMRLGEMNLWSERDDIDQSVGKIRANLHNLVADDSLRDSFFIDHYKRELDLLASRINASLTRKEILLERFHIESTEVLFSIYDSKKHTTFRATHILADTPEVFDVTYRVYLKAWLQRLAENKVACLRRLFVLDSPDQLSLMPVRKILAFHNSDIRGLECKVVSRKELLRFKSDFNITDGVVDIGIFSDAYVYLGRNRTDDQIVGHFSRDANTIQTYARWFDALWASGAASPISRFTTSTISEVQLFDPSYVLQDALGAKAPANPTSTAE